MAITLTSQGTLNRLLANLVIPNYPGLNLTASYFGKEGLRLSLDGNATDLIDTMTGGVTSPAPYMRATIAGHLLRSQALANSWKSQMETSTLIGDVTCYGDATTMGVWQIVNTSIMTVRELNFDGTDPGYQISLIGYYQINSSLYQ